MSPLDLVAVASYFVLVVGAGFWYRRRASQSLEAYFLGGKKIPWPALAMSGAVSNFDITGTMWMVSVMILLGMQSWWHHWMWGVALPAFSLAYLARWVRRSKVMTAAEWMKTRFGEDSGGRAARYASASMSILLTAATVGYAFQGIGLFAVVYLPLDGLAAHLPFGGEWVVAHQPAVLATAVFAITTLYVVMGGLYSVVLTDVIQTIVLTLAAIGIAFVAWQHLTPELIATHVPDDFDRLTPTWRKPEFAGAGADAKYEMFGFLVIAWCMKGFLMNAGGPGQLYDFQRYLAAPSVRDAAKIAAAWPFFLVVRWAMVAGITLLALTGFTETSNPEQVMPLVLREYLPAGIRGIVIAGLLAAFMSTFSSTVNSGAAFVVRDFWQPLFRPHAEERDLVRASWIATLGIVVGGVVIGYQAQSIAKIWNWIMMALGAGVIIPNVLRWHWWRFNGWGYAAGVVSGMALAVVALFVDDMPDYQLFPIICVGSLTGSIVVALLTRPTDPAILAEFRRTIRPFGFWSRTDAYDGPPGESGRRAIGNALVAVVGLTALYLGPMYLIGHWYPKAAICGACFVASVLVLWRTWYRTLAEDE